MTPMAARALAAITAASLLSLSLAPVPARALSAEDCQLWLAQLRGETASVPVAETTSGHERERLLARLDDASLQRPRVTLTESLTQVKKFQEHAAMLTAAGRVTPVEGERLKNLSETVRHCLERVRGTR